MRDAERESVYEIDVRIEALRLAVKRVQDHPYANTDVVIAVATKFERYILSDTVETVSDTVNDTATALLVETDGN